MTPPLPIDPTRVTLARITADSVDRVLALQVAEDQRGFVASNAVSLAQALFTPQAWYRSIDLDGEPVGFVMLYDESLQPTGEGPTRIGLWRFMVDAGHQHRGIGRAAIARVIEHARGKGLFTHIELSYVPGPGCPEPFYRALGFEPTGRMDGGEVVLERPLAPAAPAPSA